MKKGLIIGLGALGAGALAFFALRPRARAGTVPTLEGALSLYCDQFPDDWECLSPEQKDAIRRDRAYRALLAQAVTSAIGHYDENFASHSLRSLVDRALAAHPHPLADQAARVARLESHGIPNGRMTPSSVASHTTWWHAAVEGYGSGEAFIGEMDRAWSNPTTMDPWRKAQILLDWVALWTAYWTTEQGGRPPLTREGGIETYTVTGEPGQVATGAAYTLPGHTANLESMPPYPVEAFVASWYQLARLSPEAAVGIKAVQARVAEGEQFSTQPGGVVEAPLNLSALGIEMGCSRCLGRCRGCQ